jgi:hypothetical protein
VALIIRHAMRTRHILLSAAARLAAPHFFTYFIKGTIFREKVMGYKVFCSFLRLVSETLLVLRIKRDATIHEYRSSCKVPIIFVRF